MKKLLLLLITSFAFTSQAQDVFLTENCETLSIGNLSTDPTGASAGQNGWLTAGSTGFSPYATNANFQVVNAGSVNGNVIQINGSSTASTATLGQSRFITQDITNSWTNRTPGNDVVEVEFDLFSGAPTTSLSSFRNYILDASGFAVAGFWFAPGPYTYTPTGGTATTVTKALRGWAYYDNAGTPGYYTFKLGGTSTTPDDLILSDNTWYRIGVAYDYNTGAITWKDDSGLFYTGISTGPDAGVDLTGARFQVSSAVGNTLGANVQIDNITIKTVALEDLLGVNTNSNAIKDFSIFPNPSKGLVNINNTDTNINSIEISDLNGRVVKTVNSINDVNTQINISELSTGVYMMKIVSEKGTTTKKVIKE
jgi:hypothetical protein